ncbi:hypothetical protein [Chitinophaga ginsengisoli]|uniref:Uncharacterized protein n=1 Tax=Chitinophaga ginsengisoli TaxID=363837 RepID=A0A2P8F982_9BACT|nr:hypothetical protein [Chitinophaga ginsengisoli]PSL18255.1 hypothetical protein CLV42_1365 [Chitinophaga ginsengisoli]
MEKARLKVIGRLQKDLNKRFIHGLDLVDLKDNQLILFCDYSEFDISVDYVFTEIIDEQKGEVIPGCHIILKNVSQQFFKPFDSIPHGWKTVCKFEFVNNNIPSVIYELPEVKGWDEIGRHLFFT